MTLIRTSGNVNLLRETVVLLLLVIRSSTAHSQQHGREAVLLHTTRTSRFCEALGTDAGSEFNTMKLR